MSRFEEYLESSSAESFWSGNSGSAQPISVVNNEISSTVASLADQLTSERSTVTVTDLQSPMTDIASIVEEVLNDLPQKAGMAATITDQISEQADEIFNHIWSNWTSAAVPADGIIPEVLEEAVSKGCVK